MLRTVFASLVLLSSSVSAAADSFAPDQAKRIGANVETILRSTDTPGATIAIAKGGRIVYSHAYGLRDREHRLPAAVDTHYEIGSITKQFTAAAILQLQEAGKLHIDDKLANHLPGAPHAGEVTLRQLLSHTSGMPEYLDDAYAEQAIGKPATFEQLIARIAGKPLDFAPGSRWSYSNSGYILLGRVVEVVSHDTYRHYLQTHLLAPARMTRTTTVADEARLPDMAIGYRHENGRFERAGMIDDSVGWAAGFLVSTVDDLQKWNDALTNGRIVTPADYALMSTSTKTTAQVDAGYGLGLFVDSVDEQPRVGHTGGSLGFTTANEYFPTQGVWIIAFTNNGDNPEPGEMITTAIFETLYPAIAAAAVRPSDGEDRSVTAEAKTVFEQLQRGTGDYAQLTPKLAEKMRSGRAKRLASGLGPYGTATAYVYKGRRADGAVQWFDYVARFGPGSMMKFAIGLDADRKVASLSIN